jgi:hypothetical protein
MSHPAQQSTHDIEAPSQVTSPTSSALMVAAANARMMELERRERILLGWLRLYWTCRNKIMYIYDVGVPVDGI